MSKPCILIYCLPFFVAELPGWPLLTPLKVQMQKCDKCSREFCSPINYRRHIRVHHRLKKLDKVSLMSYSCDYVYIMLIREKGMRGWWHPLLMAQKDTISN